MNTEYSPMEYRKDKSVATSIKKEIQIGQTRLICLRKKEEKTNLDVDFMSLC